MQTFDDFMRTMLDSFPRASVDEDNDGQLVIYTDLMLNDDGNVVPFDLDEEG